MDLPAGSQYLLLHNRVTLARTLQAVAATSWIVTPIPGRKSSTEIWGSSWVSYREAGDKCECLRRQRRCAIQEERVSFWQSTQSWQHTPEREKWVSFPIWNWQSIITTAHSKFHRLTKRHESPKHWKLNRTLRLFLFFSCERFTQGTRGQN